MRNQIFHSSPKFMHVKKHNASLVYLPLHLVETFALFPNSKIVF